MADGLIDGGTRGAQLRELGIDTVALEHVNRRHCARRVPIGGGALEDAPLDPFGRAFRRRVRHILETAVDNRLEPIELRLRFPARIVPVPLAAREFRAVPIPPGSRLAGAGTGAAILAGPPIPRLSFAVVAAELVAVRRPAPLTVAARHSVASRFPWVGGGGRGVTGVAWCPGRWIARCRDRRRPVGARTPAAAAFARRPIRRWSGWRGVFRCRRLGRCFRFRRL